MQHALACETFHGGNFRAVRLSRQDRARLDGPAVQLNRASAALAGIATDVGSCKIQLFPQEINQQGPRFHNGFMLHTVDGDLYRNTGKLYLSSHAQLASIRTSHNLSLRIVFLQRTDTDQKIQFRMSYTDFAPVSIPLGEIAAMFGKKISRASFSTSDFALDKYNAFPL